MKVFSLCIIIPDFAVLVHCKMVELVEKYNKPFFLWSSYGILSNVCLNLLFRSDTCILDKTLSQEMLSCYS